MANFNEAYQLTMGDEGGYVNNPNDKGGPTYKGIAKNFWGYLSLWRRIEQILAKVGVEPAFDPKPNSTYRVFVKRANKALSEDAQLQSDILSFYKKNFWNPYRLGEINNQKIANWIFNHIVNGGAQGVKWVQLAVGVVVDGAIGPKTISAINSYDPDRLFIKLKEIASIYRIEKVEKDGSQINFLPSWLRRDGATEEEMNEVFKVIKDGRLTQQEVAFLKQTFTNVG